MRVALYKSAFAGPSDGAAETLVSYAIHLAAAGYGTTVILMYPSATDAQYSRRLEAHGISCEYLSSGKVGAGLQLLRNAALKVARNAMLMSLGRVAAEHLSARVASRYGEVLRELLKSKAIDLVHVLGTRPGISRVVETSRSIGLPVLFHELGNPEHGRGAMPYQARLNEALSYGAHVAALSPLLALQCRGAYEGVEEITILPLIVEDLGIRPVPDEGAAGQDALDVRVPAFGFSGRIEVMKGIEPLAQAFATLRRRQRPARLRIAGSGRGESAMARILQEGGAAGHFEFTGPYTRREGKRDFMHSVDVLVHPSLSEGTPNTIIEAMAAGLPIIASDVGGIPDVVSRDSGILVPPGDAHALADAMERLAGDSRLRRRMGAAGRARYERYFSAASVMPLLLRRYEALSTPRQQLSAKSSGLPSFHPWAAVET